ncbi:hypothetical protein BH11PLA2_BH11PLA2_32760 [soil metagenome]
MKLRALAKKGYIVVEPNTARGIRPAKVEYQLRHLSGGRVRIATTGPVTLSLAELSGRLSEPLQQAA